MKQIILVVSVFICSFGVKAQQIGSGYATEIPSFNALLSSGFYVTNQAQANYPYEISAWPWKHLINIRSSSSNTCEFQISTPFTHDDRLFFRKVVQDNNNLNCNNAWYEAATRGANTFTDDQFIAINKSLHIGSSTDASRRLRLTFVSGSTNGDAYIDYGGYLYFRSNINANPIISFSPYGDVRINNVFYAKEIQVKTNVWADYVFSKNYQLLTLNEVKQHIQENKHLPGIPTETEVKENGINLGEMQAKLLQKIEELTLYIIQQQEMIDELKNEVKKLKSK